MSHVISQKTRFFFLSSSVTGAVILQAIMPFQEGTSDGGNQVLISGIAQRLGIQALPSDMFWFELSRCYSLVRSWGSYLPSCVKQSW